MIIIRFLTLFFIVFSLCTNLAFAVQQGGIQYTIPIEYSLFDEKEVNAEAESLYQRFLTSEDERQKYILLETMLGKYTILGEIDKENPLYFTRLGIIFDKMHKDRWAKSNFFRSTNLNPNYPYANYSFANYYFDRKDFRKALREYLRAYNTGYNNHYETLYQIGTIYEKYGDFSSAINFYNKALAIKYSEELRAKIVSLEDLLGKNSLYNQRDRQRLDK